MKPCDPNHIHDESARAPKLQLADLVGTNDGLFIEPATLDRAVGEELVLFLRDKERKIKRLAASNTLMLKIRADFKSNQFGSFAFVLFWIFDANDKAKKPIVSFINFFNPHNKKELLFWHRLAEVDHWHLYLIIRNEMWNIIDFANHYQLEERLDFIVERSAGVATGDPIKAKELLMQEYTIQQLIEHADLTSERDTQAKQIQRFLRPPGRTEQSSAHMAKELATIKTLNLSFPNFLDMLKFAIKRKLPTCKSKVWVNLGHNPLWYGYSNGLLHVAAAICFVLEEEAHGEGQFEVSELNVRRNNGWTYVRIYDWDLVYFEPLTPAEIREIRSKTQAKSGKPSRKTANKTIAKQRNDPFETGLSLYPYMPGGEWNEPE